MLAVTQATQKRAIKRLLELQEKYLEAAHEHFEASQFDDDDEAIKANRKAERIYAQLTQQQTLVKELFKL